MAMLKCLMALLAIQLASAQMHVYNVENAASRAAAEDAALATIVEAGKASNRSRPSSLRFAVTKDAMTVQSVPVKQVDEGDVSASTDSDDGAFAQPIWPSAQDWIAILVIAVIVITFSTCISGPRFNSNRTATASSWWQPAPMDQSTSNDVQPLNPTLLTRIPSAQPEAKKAAASNDVQPLNPTLLTRIPSAQPEAKKAAE
eukprot:TRINITY_DN1476_c0_g1_i1.p1 TRINITY_DN1476_c0_g1~~TRINITY_DN1476_c0_g1_i1.p1  ORF type:complete len:225 (+),score=26.80 TRINITY_DN1476_c0_g1_i1:74-676(+)